MNPRDFRAFVVAPSLRGVGLWSEAAELLVAGTAVYESNLDRLKQVGGGPALGVYQIEPATHDDVWSNFLVYREDLARKVTAYRAMHPSMTEQLISNFAYATIMCRLVYYRDRAPLPAVGDLEAMGRYYKRVFNTPLGKGSAEGWVNRTRAAFALET